MGCGDSAMGQRYGAGGPSEPIGTALWGSAMGQGEPLIPCGQHYGEWGHLWGVGTALWGRGSHRDCAMGQGDPLTP